MLRCLVEKLLTLSTEMLASSFLVNVIAELFMMCLKLTILPAC